MIQSPALDLRIRHRLASLQLDIALQLEKGIGVLFGPSGAGKSVTLRLLAGLMVPDEGHLLLSGQRLWDTEEPGCWVPPQHRKIGFVFQQPALFPHMTVAANIAYGARGMAPTRVVEEVRRIVQEFRLEGLERSHPGEISGGEKQRVALARSLIGRPRLLLLDEPFSALDTPTRRHMRALLARTLEERSIPALLVTHDFEEVQALAAKVFVCIRGRVEQAGSPEEILSHPFLSYSN